MLQIVPLPAGLVDTLSPHTWTLKAQFSPEAPVYTSLSLDPYATWRSCLRIMCWTLAALIVRHNAVDLKGRLVVVGGMVAGGLFQAGYGLFEFISGRQHIFGYQKKYFTDVATGTFISRNNYAGYLEMTIPFALALAVLCLGRAATRHEIILRRRRAWASGRGTFRALLCLMGAFLMMTALLMSRSRMGIISIAFALVGGALTLGLHGRSRRFAIAAVGVAGLAALFASQIDILPVVRRFQSLQHEFGSGYGRLKVWTDAIGAVQAYPLLGSGLGTWELAFSPFRTDQAPLKVDFAHNDYLEFAAEAGLVGVSILGIGALLALRRQGRQPSSDGRDDEVALAAGIGLLALALHSFTDFHLSIPADALAAAVLAGLFLRRAGPASAPTNRLVQAPLRGGLLAGAIATGLVLMGLAAATPAIAQIQVVKAGLPSVDAASEEPGLASKGINRTLEEDPCPGCRLEPFNATRYFEAAGHARRRLLSDVEAILRTQSQGELPDIRSRQYLAGRLDEALAIVNAGLTLSPASGRGHLEAGLLHVGRFTLTGLPPEASEDFGQAMAAFTRAMALQPWRAATHRKIARVMAPFWEASGTEQRAFIEKTVLRARNTSPSVPDIKEMAMRMGL
ncbi:MAG: O-antigen ligase family protein [Candidatus Polarisedimenticolia bacterium]